MAARQKTSPIIVLDVVVDSKREVISAATCLADVFETCILLLHLLIRHRMVIRSTNIFGQLFGENRANKLRPRVTLRVITDVCEELGWIGTVPPSSNDGRGSQP